VVIDVDKLDPPFRDTTEGRFGCVEGEAEPIRKVSIKGRCVSDDITRGSEVGV
jgi:hypothetical protein